MLNCVLQVYYHLDFNSILMQWYTINYNIYNNIDMVTRSGTVKDSLRNYYSLSTS